MELRSFAVWLPAALLACATPSPLPSLPAAPAPDAPASSRQVSAPPPGTAVALGSPLATEVTPDHPYADLHAALVQKDPAASAGSDALAPLREGMAARLEREVEALRYRADGEATAISSAGLGEAQLASISSEIAADEERRHERSQEAEALRREAEQRQREARERERETAEKHQRELERAMRQAMITRFEEVRLDYCTTSPDSIDEIPGDMVRWRKLRRSDFRAQEESEIEFAVDMGKDAGAGAHVGLTIVCVANIGITEHAPDDFEARIVHLSYLALLDRELSWWNEEIDHISEEWTIRHEQVHFDLAEVEARRLTARSGEVIEKIRGRGKEPRAAVEKLRKGWTRHMEEVQEDFLALELRYDRETRHGNELERQTEWFERAKRGLSESQLAAGP